MKRLLLLCACTAAMTNSVLAQTPVADKTLMATQMTLPDLPTELNLKSLDSSWRRFVARDKDSSSAMYGSWGPQYQQVLNDLGIGVHFTKGDSVKIGDESYLIAYRVDPGMSPQDMQQEIQQRMQAFWGHGQQQAPPRPAGKFSPDTKLKLSLLNLGNLGNLEGLRAYSAKADLLAPGDLRDLSNANLQRLGQIVRQFSQQRPLQVRDINQLRQMMQMQHAPVSLLQNPTDNAAYGFNTALAGKKLSEISNQKSVVLAFENTPSSDATRGVLFVSGQVERVPEWKWKAVRSVQPVGPTPQQQRTASAQKLKRIFQMMQSMSSSNRRLPDTTDSAAARRELMNRFGYQVPLFKEPGTEQWYRFNTAISKKELAKITNKNQIVAVYEPTIGTDGKRRAIFLDGSVRAISNARWNAVIKTKVRTK